MARVTKATFTAAMADDSAITPNHPEGGNQFARAHLIGRDVHKLPMQSGQLEEAFMQ